MKPTKLLLYSFIFFTNFCYSQNVFFQHYTTDDGLPHNVINCLLQDDDGLLWIGTEDGLARFDGFQFQSNLLENEENNSKVIAIKVDKKKMVWVQFENGQYQGFEQGKAINTIVKTEIVNQLFQTNGQKNNINNQLINNDLRQKLNLQSTQHLA